MDLAVCFLFWVSSPLVLALILALSLTLTLTLVSGSLLYGFLSLAIFLALGLAIWISASDSGFQVLAWAVPLSLWVSFLVLWLSGSGYVLVSGYEVMALFLCHSLISQALIRAVLLASWHWSCFCLYLHLCLSVSPCLFCFQAFSHRLWLCLYLSVSYSSSS